MIQNFDATKLLPGQMMEQPLMISDIIEHAAKHHGDTEIVSRRTEGDIHRYTYAACAKRAKQVSQMLDELGVATGSRIGTLAWNGYRHLEIYYGVSGAGFICHTINPRLFQEQIIYIINHAEDQVIFFDVTFLPLVQAIQDQCPTVQYWVCLSDADVMPASPTIKLHCYESMIEPFSGEGAWPVFDENAASSLCYTSGTTGNPKGALYSHRSTVLHSYASALPDSLGISARDTIMPVVPMFHVNAWGLPYSMPLVGARIVMPGAKLDGASLYELIENEQVTFSAGVPTIWSGLLDYVKKNNLSFSSFRRTVIGGSTCPPAMIESLSALGVDVIHAWGMTELSPLGALARLKAKHANMTPGEQMHLLQKQGRPLYGVDFKIVDNDGNQLPHDGVGFGDLMVKALWGIKNYYGQDYSALTNGWFATGDVATIDADSFMQITDRSKDVIKSGGEWISSIEIENIAVSHPEVQFAACIAAKHSKWDERPLLVILKKTNSTRSDQELAKELLSFFEGKIAKWWIPDDVVFVDQMPLTATGKMYKLTLRELFKNHVLPTDLQE